MFILGAAILLVTLAHIFEPTLTETDFLLLRTPEFLQLGWNSPLFFTIVPQTLSLHFSISTPPYCVRSTWCSLLPVLQSLPALVHSIQRHLICHRNIVVLSTYSPAKKKSRCFFSLCLLVSPKTEVGPAPNPLILVLELHSGRRVFPQVLLTGNHRSHRSVTSALWNGTWDGPEAWRLDPLMQHQVKSRGHAASLNPGWG